MVAVQHLVRRRLRLLLAVSAAVAVLLCCFSIATVGTATAGTVPRNSGFGSSWTTYHGDAEATGVQPAQTALRPATRAWTSSTLDGEVYGEPLVAAGRVIAATENDTVYALSARTGHVPVVAPSGEARPVG